MSNRQYFWCIYNIEFPFEKNAITPVRHFLTEVNILLFIFVWSILNTFVFKCRNHSCYKSKCNIVCFVCSVCSLLFCNLGFIQSLILCLSVCSCLFYITDFYYYLPYFPPSFSNLGRFWLKNRLQTRIIIKFPQSHFKVKFWDIKFPQKAGGNLTI